MQSLTAILDRDELPAPEFHLDHFQSRVLDELYLEFFFTRCRVLITPHLRHLTTGPASPEEESQLVGLLTQRQPAIVQLKRLLIRELALHSALLETNSYFIAVNDHLMIARFVSRAGGFEVKLYTLKAEELPARYSDKIYLGRDLLSLGGSGATPGGLPFLRASLPEQMVKLRRRLQQHVPAPVREELEQEFLADLDEVLAEFSQAAGAILERWPTGLPASRPSEAELLDLNRRFRDVKHILLDADGVLDELEAHLLETASDAARYVTKLRKDVTNGVNYIMLKVNGRITDAVNGFRV